MSNPLSELLALAFALESLCKIAEEDASDGMLWAERLDKETGKARALLAKVDAKKYLKGGGNGPARSE